MVQDVEALHPLEPAALVAAVRETGERVGVATPRTGALLGFTRLFVRVRRLYLLL